MIKHIDDQLYVWGSCMRSYINLGYPRQSSEQVRIAGHAGYHDWPDYVERLESIICQLSPDLKSIITDRYCSQLPVQQIVKRLKMGTRQYYQMLTRIHQRIEREM